MFFLKVFKWAAACCLLAGLTACGHSSGMQIKEADLSKTEKYRMEIASSESGAATVTGVTKDLAAAQMYIEHYQNGKLTDKAGPLESDYSGDATKPKELQFIFYTDREDKGKKEKDKVRFGIVDDGGKVSADAVFTRNQGDDRASSVFISSAESVTYGKPVLIGASVKNSGKHVHMSRDKKMLISHSDVLLYYVKLNKRA
ncbi:sulfur oxidation protein [Bacillus siamensis]|uniref:sulfur oxidation protein n=1 Tax=Bacillus siamensis TaxID=659243 RepID=UPI002E1F3C20|nr:sulfur oxidation protein [Bacillus siamensis]MED5097425.1 sulfur oxidation protein [Bacillus siamensis]